MVQVPTIDLSKVPQSLEGQWVVLRASDNTALGHGDTPAAALEDAGVGVEDAGILLARIPSTRAPMIA